MDDNKTPYIIARCRSCAHIVAAAIDEGSQENDREALEWVRRGDIVTRGFYNGVRVDGCRDDCRLKSK